jgi:hypothetical protein
MCGFAERAPFRPNNILPGAKPKFTINAYFYIIGIFFWVPS